ncbi:MAG: AMP-binding protein [Bacillota bacterium]|nr:AMP-binding protein [Bacillota bacterium]
MNDEKKLCLDQWTGEKIGAPGLPLDRQELRAFQLTALRDTLALASAKSRFYKERLSNADLSLSHGPEDLEKLPFTTQEDLREQGFSMLCVSQEQISRIVTLPTSGTTGPPKRVFFTEEDQELTLDFFHRGMELMVGPGDKLLNFFPCVRPGSVGTLLGEGLARLGTASLNWGPPEDAMAAALALEEEGITAIAGAPSHILPVARAWKAMMGPEKRRKAGSSGIRTVLLSSEYVSEECLEELKELWGCRCFEHYGSTEMGLGGAVACGFGKGYHPREADLYFEIIDPASGQVLPEGEYGEVVFTTLTRRGMPLIRYRTGDRSRWIPEPCPCGSSLRRLDKVGKRGE